MKNYIKGIWNKFPKAVKATIIVIGGIVFGAPIGFIIALNFVRGKIGFDRQGSNLVLVDIE